MQNHSQSSVTKERATSELILAGAIWGLGFSVTIWGISEMPALSFSVLRFTGCFALFALIMACRGRMQELYSHLKISFWPGFFLGSGLLLQTVGLHYTTATKSGFITTLYVVMVPFAEFFWRGRKLSLANFFLLLTAIGGVALLTNIKPWDPGARLNVGDLLTLCCALTFTIQILLVDRIAKKISSPFAFNGCQSLWAIAPALAAAILFDRAFPAIPSSPKFWLSAFYMMAASSLFAFMLQIRAQKILAPFVASMLFLLEAPFSALFAWPLLGESMLNAQWIGAMLILSACGGVAVLSSKK